MSGLSQEARALIDGVADLDAPSAADKLRIQKRLSMQLGAAAFAAALTAASVPLATTGAAAPALASGAEAAAASIAPKAIWLGGWGKALLSALALGGVSVALWLGTGQTTPAPTPHVGPSPLGAQQAASAVEAALVEAPFEARGSAREQSQELPSAAPAAPLAAPTPEARAMHANTKPKSRAKLGEAPSPEAAQPDTLGAELALLGRAQSALRAGRAQEALALAAQHRAQFPEGAMKEERMGVAALAQCALGGARDEAQAFLKLASGSPLAARVRKACGLP
jgi:hypothetical protein